MTEGSEPGRVHDVGELRVQRRGWAPRLVWIVPIVAAIVGLSLLVKTYRAEGPQITISFQSAEGIEVGKTLVKYLNVTIGRVSNVSLAEDGKSVLVTADLTRGGKDVAKADSIFWVVRPRFGVGWVSGLDTLLSGSFIGVQTGSSRDAVSHFIGSENPPPLTHGPNGRQIELRAARAGSVNMGAPVYFRQFQVGRVIDLNLLRDGSTRVIVFVDAPNDRFVGPHSRFWNSSGIDVKLGTDGVKVKSESVASVLAGGVAFDTSRDLNTTGPVFTLFKDESEAMMQPYGEPRYLKLVFAHAVRGLQVDAPVEFMGINVGSVVAIDLGYEPRDQSFPYMVTVKMYPQRMGLAYEIMARQGGTDEETMANLVGQLVERGLRAQPRSSSLLTGNAYISIDFAPSSGKVKFDPTLRPLELPTLPASSNEIENRISHLAKTLDELPLRDVVTHLDTDLKDLHGNLDFMKGQLLPEATTAIRSLHSTLGTLDETLADDSSFRASVESTLSETRRTLATLRELAESLDRHPEALIRGRPAQKSPIIPESTKQSTVP